MEWNDSLATGVELIDTEHKELIRRINDVIEASRERKGKDVVESTLRFLGEFIIKHFSDEENIQRQSGYPQYPQHKMLHEQFIADYNELVRKFKEEGSSLNVVLSTNRIVVDWLIKHIHAVDKQFAKYYREHNAK